MDIQEYLTRDGRSPFDTWLRSLRDVQTRARIRVRGEKSTQQRDIKRAKNYWTDYQDRDDG